MRPRDSVLLCGGRCALEGLQDSFQAVLGQARDPAMKDRRVQKRMALAFLFCASPIIV